jgi:hypothetical protein
VTGFEPATSGATVESDDVAGLGSSRFPEGKYDESSARFGLRVAVWCAKFQVSFKRSSLLGAPDAERYLIWNETVA